MYELKNFHKTGSFATAELNSLASLSSGVVLNSLNQDSHGWEVIKVLVRTSKQGYLLFQKSDQRMEYRAHAIQSYANLARFVASEPVRSTVFEGLGSKFEGLNAFADQGWCVVDIVEAASDTLLILFKRPAQKQAIGGDS